MTNLKVAREELAPKPRLDWFIVAWFVVLHVVAIIGPFYFFSWGALLTAVALYFITGMLGITLGYHRLLTHRSFKAPRWVERTLGTMGVLALQRGPIEWVATHRMHHSFVDDARDPHNARQGFWWSHLAWMCVPNPDLRDIVHQRKFARDIVADPYLNWLSGDLPQILVQVSLGVILLAIGGWNYVIWGIFVRCAFVYHVTWFVNSATHQYGYRNFETKDLSTNNWWVALLAFGEGWHNNHHAYPDVAQAGIKWWEFDLTFLVIRLMSKLGLAYEIKLPPNNSDFQPTELLAKNVASLPAGLMP